MVKKRVVLGFPDIVADGDNPKAKAVGIAPEDTYFDGIGGNLKYSGFVPESQNATGPRWSALGELRFAALAPSLMPERKRSKFKMK